MEEEDLYSDVKDLPSLEIKEKEEEESVEFEENPYSDVEPAQPTQAQPISQPDVEVPELQLEVPEQVEETPEQKLLGTLESISTPEQQQEPQGLQVEMSPAEWAIAKKDFENDRFGFDTQKGTVGAAFQSGLAKLGDITGIETLKGLAPKDGFFEQWKVTPESMVTEGDVKDPTKMLKIDAEKLANLEMNPEQKATLLIDIASRTFKIPKEELEWQADKYWIPSTKSNTFTSVLKAEGQLLSAIIGDLPRNIAARVASVADDPMPLNWINRFPELKQAIDQATPAKEDVVISVPGVPFTVEVDADMTREEAYEEAYKSNIDAAISFIDSGTRMGALEDLMLIPGMAVGLGKAAVKGATKVLPKLGAKGVAAANVINRSPMAAGLLGEVVLDSAINMASVPEYADSPEAFALAGGAGAGFGLAATGVSAASKRLKPVFQSPTTRAVAKLSDAELNTVNATRGLAELPEEIKQKLPVADEAGYEKVKARALEQTVSRKFTDAKAIQFQEVLNMLQDDDVTTAMNQWLYTVKKSTIDKERILFSIDEALKKDAKADLFSSMGKDRDAILADSTTFFSYLNEKHKGVVRAIEEKFNESKSRVDYVRLSVFSDMMSTAIAGIDGVNISEGKVNIEDSAKLRYKASVIYGFNTTDAIMKYLDSTQPRLKADLEKAKVSIQTLKVENTNIKRRLTDDLDAMQDILLKSPDKTAMDIKVIDNINVIKANLLNPDMTSFAAIRRAVKRSENVFNELHESYGKFDKDLKQLMKNQIALTDLSTDLISKTTSKMIMDDRDVLRYNTLKSSPAAREATHLSAQLGATMSRLAEVVADPANWDPARYSHAIRLLEKLDSDIVNGSPEVGVTWQAFLEEIGDSASAAHANKMFPLVKSLDKTMKFIEEQAGIVSALDDRLTDLINLDGSSNSIIDYAADIDRTSHIIMLPVHHKHLAYHRGVLASLWENINNARIDPQLKDKMYLYLTGDVASRIRLLEESEFNWSDGHILNVLEASKVYPKELLDILDEKFRSTFGVSLDKELLVSRVVNASSGYDAEYLFANGFLNTERLARLFEIKGNRQKINKFISKLLILPGIDAVESWFEQISDLSMSNVFARFQEHDNRGKSVGIERFQKEFDRLGLKKLAMSKMSKDPIFKTVLQRLCLDRFAVGHYDMYDFNERQYRLTELGETAREYLIDNYNLYASNNNAAKFEFLDATLMKKYSAKLSQADLADPKVMEALQARVKKEAEGIFNSFIQMKTRVNKKEVTLSAAPKEVLELAFETKKKLWELDAIRHEVATDIYNAVGKQVNIEDDLAVSPLFRSKFSFNVSRKVAYDVSEFQPLISPDVDGFSKLFGSSDEAQIARFKEVDNDDLMNPLEAISYRFIRDCRNAATVRDAMELNNYARVFKDQGELAANNFIKNFLDSNVAFKMASPTGRTVLTDVKLYILDKTSDIPFVNVIVHNFNLVADHLLGAGKLTATLVKPAQIMANTLQSHVTSVLTGGSIVGRVSTDNIAIDTIANFNLGLMDLVFGYPIYFGKVLRHYFKLKYDPNADITTVKGIMEKLTREKVLENKNYTNRSLTRFMEHHIQASEKSYEITPLQKANNVAIDAMMVHLKENVELSMVRKNMIDAAYVYMDTIKLVENNKLIEAYDVVRKTLRTRTKAQAWSIVQEMRLGVENKKPYVPLSNFISAYSAQNTGRYGWFSASQLRNSMTRILPGATMFWSSRNLIMGKLLAGLPNLGYVFTDKIGKNDPTFASMPKQLQNLYVSTLLSGTMLTASYASLIYGAGSVFVGSKEEMRERGEGGFWRMMLEGIGKGFAIDVGLPSVSPLGLFVSLPNTTSPGLLVLTLLAPEMAWMYETMSKYTSRGFGLSLPGMPTPEKTTLRREEDALRRRTVDPMTLSEEARKSIMTGQDTPDRGQAVDERIAKVHEKRSLLEAFDEETFWVDFADLALEANVTSAALLTNVIKRPALLTWLFLNDQMEDAVYQASQGSIQYRPVETMRDSFGRVADPFVILDLVDSTGLVDPQTTLDARQGVIHTMDMLQRTDQWANFLYYFGGLDKRMQEWRNDFAKRMSSTSQVVNKEDARVNETIDPSLDKVVDHMMETESEKKK